MLCEQIHTHMCYSHFNDIIHSIIDMDADVITIENSRSDEKLLSVFREGVTYGAGIGPGVYDIHSPRVPSTEEMAERVRKVRTFQDCYISCWPWLLISVNVTSYCLLTNLSHGSLVCRCWRCST